MGYFDVENICPSSQWKTTRSSCIIDKRHAGRALHLSDYRIVTSLSTIAIIIQTSASLFLSALAGGNSIIEQ